MLHDKEIREERKQGYLPDSSMHTHKGICDKMRGKSSCQLQLSCQQLVTWPSLVLRMTFSHLPVQCSLGLQQVPQPIMVLSWQGDPSLHS